jgi:hypothetical protein
MLKSVGRPFGREEIQKLSDAVARQRFDRKIDYITANMTVADLSFGFWCSILTKHYEVPLGWGGKNLRRVLGAL